MSAPARTRLPAAERRAALVDCACTVFSSASYRGATTADIARAAGVTEPVLYRHFESKRDLYLACLDEAWARIRALWDGAVEAEPDPALWLAVMGRAYLSSEEHKLAIGNLWMQAFSEASEDEAIRAHMRAHLREVHAYVREVIERSQAREGIEADRDPEAEGWIFLSLGLFLTVNHRLGDSLVSNVEAILGSRRRWLTGRD